ncbi:MAG: DNRLRE domain-containing protein, partial [Chloroflexota bacterium]
VFTATADAYVSSAHKSTNYGSSTVLKVRKDVYRSFVKFSVTGLSRAPSSARLRLWVTNPSTSGGSVYRVSNSWTQSGITWNNAPIIGSAPRLANLATTTSGTWVDVSVKSAITGTGTYTFRITGGNTNQAEYATRETSHDPVLIVTP